MPFDGEDSALDVRGRRLHVTSTERKSKAEVMRKERRDVVCAPRPTSWKSTFAD